VTKLYPGQPVTLRDKDGTEYRAQVAWSSPKQGTAVRVLFNLFGGDRKTEPFTLPDGVEVKP
jgi:hypothetical protein